MNFLLKIIFVILVILSILFIVLGFYASDGLLFAVSLLFIIATFLVGLEIRKNISNPFDQK